MFAPKKGKQATKGQKQIYEGNQETIKFYAIIAIVPIILRYLFASTTSLPLSSFSIVVQVAALSGMYYMAKPILATGSGGSKTVIDGGIDLNLPSGFADHVKDLIITTAACTVLSIFSNLFWILWLWLPVFLVYKVWVGLIAPWIFAPAPEGPPPEVAEKKRKKMERKMARASNYR